MLNILSHRCYTKELKLPIIISFPEEIDVSEIETNWRRNETYLPMDKTKL